MATSKTMFVEQAHHFPMASSSNVWLHINGLVPNNDNQSLHSTGLTNETRTRNSRPQSQSSAQSHVPYHITIIDGPFKKAKQQPKLDPAENSKRILVEKHSRKSKTLPGVIKGNTHSRHTPLQSVSFLIPTPPNPSVNNSHDDIALAVANERSEMMARSSMETRRPRVNFSDLNNVQLFDEFREESENKFSNYLNNRRFRHRFLSKNRNLSNETNQITVPSIPTTQLQDNLNRRSYSRYHQVQTPIESTTNRKSLRIPIRATSLNVTQLPEIVKASLQRENIFNETFKISTIRSKQSQNESSTNVSIDVGRDSMGSRRGSSTNNETNTRQRNSTNFNENERNNSALPNRRRSSILSVSTGNQRQKSSVRAVSLRQQNPAPFKMDSVHRNSQLSHYQTSNSTNARNSARTREPRDDLSIDDSSTNNGKSLRQTDSARQIKRSTIIHFNSKNSSAYHLTGDHKDFYRSNSKPTSRKSSADRFHNLLTVVRPPIVSNGSTQSVSNNNDATNQAAQAHHPFASAPSRHGRRASAQGPLEFHISTNTIVV